MKPAASGGVGQGTPKFPTLSPTFIAAQLAAIPGIALFNPTSIYAAWRRIAVRQTLVHSAAQAIIRDLVIYTPNKMSNNPLSKSHRCIEMTNEPSDQPHITIRIAYKDAHLIELETDVVLDDRRGVASAYTSSDSLRQAAAALAKWSNHPKGLAEIQAGSDIGIGWLLLEFYPIDNSGHLVCHVQLATKEVRGGDRPESI